MFLPYMAVVMVTWLWEHQESGGIWRAYVVWASRLSHKLALDQRLRNFLRKTGPRDMTQAALGAQGCVGLKSHASINSVFLHEKQTHRIRPET